MEEQGCKISRWQILTSKLNNLDGKAFLEAIRPNDSHQTILDVRTMKEFEDQHLEHAVNLDYLGHSFLDDLEKLPIAHSYYVYCRSGRRSARVCTLMQNMGFEKVYNLEGGLNNLEGNVSFPLKSAKKN